MHGSVGMVSSRAGDVNISGAAVDVGMSVAVPIWLKVAVDEVTVAAVVACPVGEPDPLGRPHVGPHMRDAIDGRVIGMKGVVTANRPYALSVHEGARAHEIPTGGAAAQKAKGYPLRFLKDGVVRRPWSVRHPGNTKPNPWLVRALQAVIGGLS